MTVQLGWGLALTLVLLVAVGVAVSLAGRLKVEREILVAAVRAIIQLAAVSLLIAAAVAHPATAWLFVGVMFAVAVFTTTRRVRAPRAWPWAALAMATGIVPVLAIIFGTGAVPLAGVTVVSVAGIIVGNMMTAHTLVGRRCFAELESGQGVFEGALALGMNRRLAIDMVIRPVVAEALIPNLDQTRTVGLVTLPGAFVGVLLGGGSPLQAGAAQVLVLLGIMAGQTITVVMAADLILRARLLTPSLKHKLHR